MTMFSQTIRFCTTFDGVRLAYATTGQGPTIVRTATWLTHLDFDWHSPVWQPWLSALSQYHTLIRYDQRGCGLSDWDVEQFTFDAWLSDLETVIDAAGLERFALLGMSQGGPVALAYAVKYPERVSHLVLYGAYARGASKRNPTAQQREENELLLKLIRIGWDKDNPAFRQTFTSMFIPEGNQEQIAWFNDLQRISTTPENAAKLLQGFHAIDVQELAFQVTVPTLVFHAMDDARVPFQEGRLLATLIPNARFVPLDSKNHVLLEHEPAWRVFLTELYDFLGGPPSPNVTQTYTDIATLESMSLSRRERDILALILNGLNNKEIAKQLFLSPKTVRNYISTLYSKLGVHSRSELIVKLQHPS